MHQRFEAADSILDRRMACEGTVGAGLELLDGIGNEEMGGAPIGHLKLGRVRIDFSQSIRQSFGVTSQLHRRSVRHR